MRVRMIEARRAANDNPFPHKFHVSTSLENFIKKYENTMENGEVLENEPVSVAGLFASFLAALNQPFSGRIFNKREAGAKLIFYDLHGECTKVQVLANARYHKGSVEFEELHDRIKRGDIVGINGYPTRSKAGELSILPFDVIQLTPCLHMIPNTHFGLKNTETR